MKLSPIFPIENCVINGYSLVDNVFGPGFVVHEMLGAMRTSARNVKRYALFGDHSPALAGALE